MTPRFVGFFIGMGLGLVGLAIIILLLGFIFRQPPVDHWLEDTSHEEKQ